MFFTIKTENELLSTLDILVGWKDLLDSLFY